MEDFTSIAGIFNAVGLFGFIAISLFYLIFIKLKNKNSIETKNADTNNQISLIEAQNKSMIASAKMYEDRFNQIDARFVRIEDKMDEVSDKLSQYAGIHTPEYENQSLRINEHIDDMLLELLNATKSQRAYYFRFHNGGRSVDNMGFQKMSISNEQTVSWVARVMKDCQNIQRSMLPSVYRTITKNAGYIINDVDQLIETDQASYQFFSEHGAKMVFMRALKQYDGLVSGFVAIEFMNNDGVDKDAVEHCLEEEVSKLTGLLVGFDAAWRVKSYE